MIEQRRVIIVGGGPVGLIAALALARASIPVLVLEAEAAPVKDLRAAAFHPPTLEIFARLGIADDLLALGVVVPVWQIRDRDSGVIAAFDLSVLADVTPYPYRFHLGQHRLVPVLLERLTRHPHAEIRFSARVAALAQGADQVDVTLMESAGERPLAAEWLIGADGSRSTVRQAIGVAFPGYTWPEEFVVNNLAAEAIAARLEAQGFAKSNYVSAPDGWAVILELSDDWGRPAWRVTFPTEAGQSPTRQPDPAGVLRRLSDYLPGLEAEALHYTGVYRVHQRVADDFRRGRVLLAGDAAHINNPLGGFGLNSGIQDAFNLAEKLVAVWRGEAPPDLLDRYVRQRRHANLAYVQASSIRNKQVLEERDPARRRAAHDELRRTAADPEGAKRYMLNSSMITSVREAARIE